MSPLIDVWATSGLTEGRVPDVVIFFNLGLVIVLEPALALPQEARPWITPLRVILHDHECRSITPVAGGKRCE